MIGALLLILYQAIGTLACVLLSPWLAWRARSRPREMAERLGRNGARGAERPLWIHAASLGELEGLRAMLARPGRGLAPPVLLTVLSVSVRDRAGDLERAGVRVRFAPLDLWFCLLPFLRRERPRGLLLLETELWPATLAACRARRVPVAVLNGRLSARKWEATRLLAPMLRPLLGAVDGCAAQSEADAARFRALGLERVTLTGNLKYRLGDVRPTGPAADDGRFLFVAGSLRRGEEAVLAAIREAGITAVVAPRHLREAESWVRACRARGLTAVRRSGVDLEVPSRDDLRDPAARSALRRRATDLLSRTARESPAVLLVVTHGELGSWSAAAAAAFVGGTLAPIGGHSLFEPAREGVPVAFGPHTAGVRDLAEPLLRAGGGREVRTATDLVRWLAALQSDAAFREASARGALAAAREVSGAAERTWEFVSRLPWVGVTEAGPSDESGAAG